MRGAQALVLRAAIGLVCVAAPLAAAACSGRVDEGGTTAAPLRDASGVDASGESVEATVQESSTATASSDAARSGAAPPDATIPPDAGACASGCANARCFQILATGQAGASALALDGTSVYWTTNYAEQPSRIMRVALDGGTAEQLASLTGPVWALAVDPTSLYFTNGTAANVAIERMPLAGGAPTTLASDQATQVLAIDSTSIYWANVGTGTIMKASLDGTNPTVLASNQPMPSTIALDATSVIWTNIGRITGSINAMVSSVMKVEKTGGAAPVTLATDQYMPNSIAISGTTAYWVTEYGTVASEPVAGGTVSLLGAGQDQPTSVVVDGTTVYWANMGAGASGSIGAVPTTGGTPVLLYQTEYADSGTGGAPEAIALDATYLYWADSTRGTINRICK